LAFSNSRLCLAGKFLPARLMKNWTMRIPDPIPFGLTFLLAIALATVLASLVNKPGGGKVETVFTWCDQRLDFSSVFFLLAIDYSPDSPMPTGCGMPFGRRLSQHFGEFKLR
jgi:hypothetical protein